MEAMTSLVELDENLQEQIESTLPQRPVRSAWIEINTRRLQRNFEIVNAFKPPQVRLLSGRQRRGLRPWRIDHCTSRAPGRGRLLGRGHARGGPGLAGA